ncbi:hypothetical protein [Enterobacter cloacae]|uniref:hypothetical protein n=1 Tax=Enterobacter cloacae TaxID=550 RepID=UPI002002BE38|nr:hypothetical protein [Enterobacter cloacae]MCK6721035.1 hypothetical protein [Enterobacter cloacae]MCU6414340.1 hypothetical protein [Enterobacter cloacae]HBN5337575.1 hypothetical protein [Enterobacter cloacae]
MLSNRLNYMLIAVVICLCIVTIAVMLKALIFGVKEMTVSDYSNVIIAICNVAMAIAALYAAINAKNWLGAKKKETSLHLVAKFHENHIIPLEGMMRRALLGVEIISNEVILRKNREQFEKERNENNNPVVQKNIKTLISHLNESYKIYRVFYMTEKINIRKSETILQLHGWKLNNKKNYEELMRKQTDFFESLLSAIDQLDNYISIYYGTDRIMSHKAKIGDDSIFFDADKFYLLRSFEKKLSVLEDEVNSITKKLSYDIWI